MNLERASRGGYRRSNEPYTQCEGDGVRVGGWRARGGGYVTLGGEGVECVAVFVESDCHAADHEEPTTN